MWWPVIGEVVVGIGGLIDPRALGVGYPNIAQMLAGGLVGISALRLLVVKAVIWSVALGSGTSSGVLAPLLIIGGSLGALLAPWLPAAAPGFWAVLGMAVGDRRPDDDAAGPPAFRSSIQTREDWLASSPGAT
jgi:H+/Cl- antiporter ClcA